MQTNYIVKNVAKKLKIEKINIPQKNKTHILYLYSKSQHGFGIKGIFKGTYEECKLEKQRLEDKKNTNKNQTQNEIINDLKEWLKVNKKVCLSHNNSYGVKIADLFLDKIHELEEEYK